MNKWSVTKRIQESEPGEGNPVKDILVDENVINVLDFTFR